MLEFPSVFLFDTLEVGVSGQRMRCLLPGVNFTFRLLDGVGTETPFLGDLAGDLDFPSSKLRFLLTICLVFLGDLAARSFFLTLSLVLDVIRPVVTVLPPFLSSLREPTARSIWRAVALVSKLLGLLRKERDRFKLLLLFGLRAGGCIELAELGALEPRAEEFERTLLGA